MTCTVNNVKRCCYLLLSGESSCVCHHFRFLSSPEHAQKSVLVHGTESDVGEKISGESEKETETSKLLDEEEEISVL